MAKVNVFGFVDNTDYLQEANEEMKKDKEIEELENLKYFLDCQEELAKILEDGWGCVLNDAGEWEIESATGNFKGTGKTYREAFFEMYYSVLEYQEQQEEDETYFGESAEYWRDYWGKKEREWINSNKDDDDFGF